MIREAQETFTKRAEVRTETAIQADFGWNKRVIEDGRGVFYYPDEAIPALSASGLDEVMYMPDAVGVLNGFRSSEVGDTGFSTVYDLEETGVEVEKHHPDVRYEKAFSDVMRRIPSAFILEYLQSSLKLQEILADEPQYTSPRMLGHLVLNVSGESDAPARHYSIRERLNTIAADPLDRIGSVGTERKIREGFAEHQKQSQRELADLVEAAGFKPHNVDTAYVIDQEGRLVTGVTAKPAHPLRKCPDSPKTPTVAVYKRDYYAPWLRTEPKPTKSQSNS